MRARILTALGILAVGAFWPGCDCSSSPSGGIPCKGTSASECPPPTTCDVAKGFCIDARDDGGTVYSCKPPIPGCACAANDPAINCVAQGTDPNVLATCNEGKSLCESGAYAACKLVPNLMCSGLSIGPGKFNPNPTNSENVKLGTDGQLLLNPSAKQVDFGFLWIANTGENTVSKIDVDTGDEVARYASVRDSAALGLANVPTPGAHNGTADPTQCANCPSRTAIDFNGDAFVANRAFEIPSHQGSITKYGNKDADCIDRNGNGKIDTSRDLNGDHKIDKNDVTEFLGENDECILWTVKVGGSGGIPRALAVDAGGPDGENGNLWVGLYGEQRAVQLSGKTGAPILNAAGMPVSVALKDATGAIHPYGAAIDGAGNVWFASISEDPGSEYLAKVNSVSKTLEKMYLVTPDSAGCTEGYGITVDNKGRVWEGSYDCKSARVFLPATETFISRLFPAETPTRGIAVDVNGDVWVAMTGPPSRVARMRGDDVVAMGQMAPAMIYTLPPPPAPNPQVMDNTIGVGIDRNGNTWAVSRNDGAATGAITRIMPSGDMASFPVGKAPYTYSDFTGYGLLSVVRPSGFFRSVVEGCPSGMTKWRSLTWSETEPMGTSVRLRVRFANTIAALQTATWFGPFDAPLPPVNLMALMVPTTKYAQVEVQLSTTIAGKTPVFSGYTLAFDGCSTPIN